VRTSSVCSPRAGTAPAGRGRFWMFRGWCGGVAPLRAWNPARSVPSWRGGRGASSPSGAQRRAKAANDHAASELHLF
jgi:hypothetical protein